MIWNTLVDLDKFCVNFYDYDCTHPTVASDLEGLMSELKGLISEIPNVTITEER